MVQYNHCNNTNVAYSYNLYVACTDPPVAVRVENLVSYFSSIREYMREMVGHRYENSVLRPTFPERPVVSELHQTLTDRR
jgi:hypothetical protein